MFHLFSITLGAFDYFTIVYIPDSFYIFSLMASLFFSIDIVQNDYFYSSVYLNGEKEKKNM